MKTLVKAFALFTMLAGMSFAQTALTQTSLSAAVNGASLSYGGSNSVDTSVALTSVTGVSAQTAAAGFQSYLYVDKEVMAVVSVNTTTKIAQVLRGVEGTSAADHANAAMVLIGPPAAFYKYDPSGACTAASTAYTPWVNVTSAQQWLCSTVTKTWVPGFQNQGLSASPNAVSAAVASAAGQITPSGPLFHITGTAAITGFLIPIGMNATTVGGSSFCVIPDGIFTTTTANNIALASTAVVNKQLCFLWDATNSKFVPSY